MLITKNVRNASPGKVTELEMLAYNTTIISAR